MDFKLPQRFENSNKSSYGRVLNISGSDYMPGAAYLSSMSAFKIGCGYCFLATSEKVIRAVASQTQSIIFVPTSDIKKSSADVVLIGCGLGTDDRALNSFKSVMDTFDRNKPLVIDADGLNIIAKWYPNFSSKGFKNVVFTPHPKEAARLLECSVEEVLSDIKFAATRITEKYGCITVLKTNKTVVNSPDGRVYTNSTGNNCMAKAGSGDVLAGIISGLAAQKMDLFEASCLGVYLHGLCGDIAKEKLTEYCVMPVDLISFLPDAIKCFMNN